MCGVRTVVITSLIVGLAGCGSLLAIGDDDSTPPVNDAGSGAETAALDDANATDPDATDLDDAGADSDVDQDAGPPPTPDGQLSCTSASSPTNEEACKKAYFQCANPGSKLPMTGKPCFRGDADAPVPALYCESCTTNGVGPYWTLNAESCVCQ